MNEMILSTTRFDENDLLALQTFRNKAKDSVFVRMDPSVGLLYSSVQHICTGFFRAVDRW